MSGPATIWSRRRDRFRLVDFLVKIWLAWDFLNLYFPDPVFLNRLAAARVVLILGMSLLLVLGLAVYKLQKKREGDAYLKSGIHHLPFHYGLNDLAQDVQRKGITPISGQAAW
jgi:hypothetical protein